MTETNKVGYIGGMELTSYVASSMSFEQGVKYANPDAQVLQFVGNFNDPVAAKNVAIAQVKVEWILSKAMWIMAFLE
jgi:basic membrane protein A